MKNHVVWCEFVNYFSMRLLDIYINELLNAFYGPFSKCEKSEIIAHLRNFY